MFSGFGGILHWVVQKSVFSIPNCGDIIVVRFFRCWNI